MSESRAGPSYSSSIKRLLEAIGIEPISYERFVAWALCEHLVSVMASAPEIEGDFFDRQDALRIFRNLLSQRTRQVWAPSDLAALYDRVKAAKTKHFRKPVPYDEYLRLLWQVPLQCAHCGRSPPEVQLHVDHLFPASKGGASKRANLQFLCAEHNLRKGASLEPGEPWLNLGFKQQS